MKKKKSLIFMSALLILVIITTMIFTSSCSKSTEPTDVVFTALPYAGVDCAYGFAEGVNNDGSIVLGGSAVNTPDNGKYFEIPPVYWTEDVVTILPFPTDHWICPSMRSV